jgi:hypothetical protein
MFKLKLKKMELMNLMVLALFATIATGCGSNKAEPSRGEVGGYNFYDTDEFFTDPDPVPEDEDTTINTSQDCKSKHGSTFEIFSGSQDVNTCVTYVQSNEHQVSALHFTSLPNTRVCYVPLVAQGGQYYWSCPTGFCVGYHMACGNVDPTGRVNVSIDDFTDSFPMLPPNTAALDVVRDYDLDAYFYHAAPFTRVLVR